MANVGGGSSSSNRRATYSGTSAADHLGTAPQAGCFSGDPGGVEKKTEFEADIDEDAVANAAVRFIFCCSQEQYQVVHTCRTAAAVREYSLSYTCRR